MKGAKNSLIFQIMVTVIIGIISVTVLISGLMIRISTDIFIDTYGKSQEQVFEQMEQECNTLHENISLFLNRIDTSWAFRRYFSHQNEMDDFLRFRTIYQMKQDLKKALPSNLEEMSLLVLNQDGDSFLNQDERLVTSEQEILASSITKRAFERKNTMVYEYRNHGFTSSTQHTNVLLASKVLYDSTTKKSYAIVYISIKEQDILKFYRSFVSKYSHFYLVDQDNRIVLSDQREEIDSIWALKKKQESDSDIRSLEEKDGKKVILLGKELPYYQWTLYGVIDTGQVLEKLYDIPSLTLIASGIGGIVVCIVFSIMKQTTKPLSLLIQKMSVARESGFRQTLPISGSREVQQLTMTYNAMLEDIEGYIIQLLKVQKEKRKAEIHALQMQINPHYIYNTLTSIKWLIWQGDTKKSVQALDAFILLLRNTIGNEDEFILLSKEIENLQNYVLINQIRYGNQIDVQYEIEDTCKNYDVPKLMLQPFVENAFFHGYPSGQTGTITIQAKVENQMLVIKVIDDGVGMSKETLKKVYTKEEKGEHFTGIGIHNVDDRLRLLYGEDCGIRIESKEQEGTTISIQMPVIYRGSEKKELNKLF